MTLTRPAMSAALAILGLAACAPAPPPPGVCAQPEVVARVLDRLAQAGDPVTLEPGSVGQVPGGVDRVNCALRIRHLVYDTVRRGPAPVVEIREVRYVLELRQNALFLVQDSGTLSAPR